MTSTPNWFYLPNLPNYLMNLKEQKLYKVSWMIYSTNNLSSQAWVLILCQHSLSLRKKEKSKLYIDSWAINKIMIKYYFSMSRLKYLIDNLDRGTSLLKDSFQECLSLDSYQIRGWMKNYIHNSWLTIWVASHALQIMQYIEHVYVANERVIKSFSWSFLCSIFWWYFSILYIFGITSKAPHDPLQEASRT